MHGNSLALCDIAIATLFGFHHLYKESQGKKEELVGRPIVLLLHHGISFVALI